MSGDVYRKIVLVLYAVSSAVAASSAVATHAVHIWTDEYWDESVHMPWHGNGKCPLLFHCVLVNVQVYYFNMRFGYTMGLCTTKC